jgi:hypothetical protein
MASKNNKIKLFNTNNIDMTEENKEEYYKLYIKRKKTLRKWHNLSKEHKAIKFYKSGLHVTDDFWLDIVMSHSLLRNIIINARSKK